MFRGLQLRRSLACLQTRPLHTARGVVSSPAVVRIGLNARSFATDAKSAAPAAPAATKPADKPAATASAAPADAKSGEAKAATPLTAAQKAMEKALKRKLKAEQRAASANDKSRKPYFGSRASIDTERMIDTRRYEKQLAEVRARYTAEYREKKREYDEHQMRALQAMLCDKAERMNAARSKARIDRIDWERREAQRLRAKAGYEKHSSLIRRDRDLSRLKRRTFQLEHLRKEYNALPPSGEAVPKWLMSIAPNEFDIRYNEATFFDSTPTAPQGYWPEYHATRTTQWEQVVSFDPVVARYGPDEQTEEEAAAAAAAELDESSGGGSGSW